MKFKVSDTDNFFVDFDKAYIAPPKKLPFYIKIGAWISKKVIKKDLMIPKLLAWYPKSAISSGVVESLVAHDDKEISKRMLKIIRIQVSCMAACPFCIDMNSFEYEEAGLSRQEVMAIKDNDYENSSFFSEKEKIIMDYVKHITETPVIIPKELVDSLKSNFSERGIVIISTTAAQVNYWARLIRSLGVPVAGFTDVCSLEK